MLRIWQYRLWKYKIGYTFGYKSSGSKEKIICITVSSIMARHENSENLYVQPQILSTLRYV